MPEAPLTPAPKIEIRPPEIDKVKGVEKPKAPRVLEQKIADRIQQDGDSDVVLRDIVGEDTEHRTNRIGESPLHPENRVAERAKNYDVLGPQEFRRDLLTELSTANKRVLIQVMEMDLQGENMNGLLQAMSEPRNRGVSVRVNVDELSLQRQPDLLNRLQDAGIEITVIKEGRNIIDRRIRHDHRKIEVIDDVGYIGGMNLTENTFRYPIEDCMVKLTDPNLVNALADQAVATHEGRPFSDVPIQSVDGKTTLITDSGESAHSRLKGESLILREAVTLVDNAQESIHWLSQYPPEVLGRFSGALNRAIKRGVPQVEGLISPSTYLGSGHRQYNEAIRRLRELFKAGRELTGRMRLGENTIHAKVIIVDGKRAIVGSHNFADMGVRLGTREVALRTENQTLVQNLERFHQAVRTRSLLSSE